MPGSPSSTKHRSIVEAAQLVEELRSEISELSQQTRLLRMAIDEYHTDFVWVMRNLPEWMAGEIPSQAVAKFRTALPDDTRDSSPLPRGDQGAVIEAYIQHMADFEEAVEPPDDEIRSQLEEHRLLLPDLVSFGSPDQYIAVRPKLTEKERADMHQWLHVLGGDSEAVRVWPDSEGENWTWMAELIATTDEIVPDNAAERTETEEDEVDPDTAARADSCPVVTPPVVEPVQRLPQPSEDALPTARPAHSPVAASGPQRRRTHTQPLYMRVVFQPHMTDVVRVFGYHELAKDDANAKLAPLMEKYGPEKICDAMDELVENVSERNIVRLSAAAREASRTVLGRPPQDGTVTASQQTKEAAAVPMPVPVPKQPNPAVADVGQKRPSSSAAFPVDLMVTGGKPATCSRAEALTKVAEFLRSAGCVTTPISPDTLHEFQRAGRTPPDFAIHNGDLPIYALIRRKLTQLIRHDVENWGQVIGAPLRAVHIWPTAGDAGWNWKYEWLAE